MDESKWIDVKGKQTAKSFYNTKKGASQRINEIKGSLRSTSETTMQKFRGGETSKPHSYEAIKIELLDSPINASLIRSFNIGQSDSDTKEFTRISISGAKLLNNVEKSKDFGKNLLEEHETDSRDYRYTQGL